MRNLQRLFDKIPVLTREKGLVWYQEANNFCQVVADKYDLDPTIVCAIVSALSPASNWEQNKKDALRLIEINKDAQPKGYRFVTYGQNVIKAQKIYDGKLDPFQAFSPNTGPKTYNFFHNILDPTNADFVTVDRHMVKIVIPNHESDAIRGKRYQQVAEHIKKTASKLSLIPAQLQAILWIDYRENNVNNFKTFNVPF